ncbi:unnamed protein product, partial [Mesorhabditis spiculigera]
MARDSVSNIYDATAEGSEDEQQSVEFAAGQGRPLTSKSTAELPSSRIKSMPSSSGTSRTPNLAQNFAFYFLPCIIAILLQASMASSRRAAARAPSIGGITSFLTPRSMGLSPSRRRDGACLDEWRPFGRFLDIDDKPIG